MLKRIAALLLGVATMFAFPVANAAPATQLRITPTAPTISAGSPVTIIVEAIDATASVDTGFTGTIYFGSSDDFAFLPPNYTFTGGDAGTHIFTAAVTFLSAGSQTIAAATMPPNTFITGISNAVTVNGGTAASLTVTGPGSASVTLPTNVTVTARDAWGNLANLYGGTINITSSDGAATLPAPAVLTGGTGTRVITFNTIGTQTVTATDSVIGSLTATSAGIPVAATPVVTPAPASLDFGGQSMMTTAPSQAVTITNSGGGVATISSITASTHFGVTHNCGATINPGANCTANVTFTPTLEGARVGTLTIVGNAGTQTVNLAGIGEKSLVTHYYRSILRRAPDAPGKAFWDGEAARLAALGANVNETWYAMAISFYSSSEYGSFNRTDAEFVGDLYNTFFNRVVDAPGLAFWTGQMTGGMPRQVVLISFLFSTEFANFSNGIFGTTAVRAEIDAVTDFYRGLLSRLPDDAGFNFWLQKFRVAQCLGAGSVTAEAESISSQFVLGSEYIARNRTNAQYVGDLYNAFLRRGGDLTGVLFWVGQITDGTQTREQVRQAFVASPEFSARVNAVIAAGTFPGITCQQPGVDLDINGVAIPSPTGPAGATMCDLNPLTFQTGPYPGGGPGPCGSHQINVGTCSSGMTGVNAINKAYQYNLEDMLPGSPRLGNSMRLAIPRDAAMVFRFKTGPASRFPRVQRRAFLSEPDDRLRRTGEPRPCRAALCDGLGIALRLRLHEDPREQRAQRLLRHDVVERQRPRQDLAGGERAGAQRGLPVLPAQARHDLLPQYPLRGCEHGGWARSPHLPRRSLRSGDRLQLTKPLRPAARKGDLRVAFLLSAATRKRTPSAKRNRSSPAPRAVPPGGRSRRTPRASTSAR